MIRSDRALNYMKKTAILSLLAVSCGLCQQEAKFDLADVHVSKTAPGFVQSFGGQINKGRYVNRETTMLQMIAAAYGVSEDVISGGPGWVSSDLFVSSPRFRRVRRARRRTLCCGRCWRSGSDW